MSRIGTQQQWLTTLTRTHFQALFLALVCLLLPGNATASWAAPNLVINGTFSSPYVSSSWVNYSGPSTAITSWTLTTGSVALISSNSAWALPTGDPASTQMLEMDNSTVQQPLATTAGIQYQLSFEMSQNPDYAATQVLTVGMSGGGTQNFTYAQSNTKTSMDWILEQATFTATGASSVLSFTQAGGYGAMFTDVSLVATASSPGVALTPEPPLFLLLCALCAAGVASTRAVR